MEEIPRLLFKKYEFPKEYPNSLPPSRGIYSNKSTQKHSRKIILAL